MPIVEMICLANSRKRQGRCIAGIRTDGHGWIRPITNTPDKELYLRHLQLDDGSEVRVLDLIRLEVVVPQAVPHQPENWTLGRTRWKLVERPVSQATMRQTLRPHLVNGPELLGNSLDRISHASFSQTPAFASLALVFLYPQAIKWKIKIEYGKRKTRVLFSLNGVSYNLSLTDPFWEQRLSGLPDGVHSSAAAGLDAKNGFLLTVSLSEPFNGDCYKLVAAVIVL